MLAGDAITAQVGRRIGPFRLIGLLGEGGMGAVYLAERDDAQFTHRVAIKILSHSVGSPEAIARFRDERQILAALEHPNIVRLLDGGSTDDDQAARAETAAANAIDASTCAQTETDRARKAEARVQEQLDQITNQLP